MRILTGVKQISTGRGNVPGGAIVAASLALVDVQAAVNLAADGGAVVLPAGDVTWAVSSSADALAVGTDNCLVIENKAVRLIGNGNTGATGNRTIIRHDGLGAHRLIHVFNNTSTAFGEITGIDFRGTAGYNYSFGTCFFAYCTAGWNNLRIHHCSFDNFDVWLGEIYTMGAPLFDHNTITGSRAGILLHGNSNAEWLEAPNLGSANWCFLEDNNWNWTNIAGTTKCQCNDLTDGGRMVFRHNTVVNGFVQTHDKARNGTGGGAYWDINNNNFSCIDSVDNLWKAIDLSSGSGVAWNNAVTNYCIHPLGVVEYRSDNNLTPLAGQTHCNGLNGGASVDQDTGGGQGYICEMQFGSGYTPGTSTTRGNIISQPAYFWGNTYNGSPTALAITYTDSGTLTNLHIQINRDYFESTSTAKPGYTSYTYPHPLQASGTTWT